MTRLIEKPLIIGARSALFHLASALTVALFAPFLVLAWAPIWVGWPVLKTFVNTQLWLLRVICNQSYRVSGAQSLADAPVILAARHEALWETLVLPCLFHNPVVLLKEEILRYPLAGPVARTLGYIGLNRTGNADAAKAAFVLARQRAAEGRSFLIFPSGTRDPAHRYRVQKGVAVLYRTLNLPCVPIVLNSGTTWPYKSWMRRPGIIDVRVLPAIPTGLQTSEFLAQLVDDLAKDPAQPDPSDTQLGAPIIVN